MDENTKLSSIVIDASGILAILLPDEQTSHQIETYLQGFAKQSIDFFAPHLLKYEVANALCSAIKRNRISPTIAKKLYEQFLKLPILYKEPSLPETLLLATENNLSVYDAAYLQLALTHKLTLITFDKQLERMYQQMMS